MTKLLKSLNWPLIVVAFFLVIIGLFELYFLSGASGSLFRRQFIFLGVGFLLVLFVSGFDFRILQEKGWLALSLYVLCVLALAGLFFAGEEIRGAKKWYKLGELTIDPVQFLKLVIIVILAKCYAGTPTHLPLKVILKTFIYLLVPVLLIIFQPDLGSVVILFSLWLGMLFLFGLSFKHFLVIALIFLLFSSLAWGNLLLPYQRSRIVNFLNPQLDPQGSGYNLRQSLIAVGHGGLWGQGAQGLSQARLGFLPEPETDFMVAAFSEHFGFVGITFLVFFWLLLIFLIEKVAFSTRSRFGFFLVSGVALWIFAQGVVSISVVCGLLPVVGVAFPFVSYSGSSLVALFIGLGLVQSVYLRNSA